MAISFTNSALNETQYHYSKFNSGDNYRSKPFLGRKAATLRPQRGSGDPKTTTQTDYPQSVPKRWGGQPRK
jgi:hypothetical protein